MQKHIVCSSAELKEKQCMEYKPKQIELAKTKTTPEEENAIFILRYNNKLHAYRNRCPHMGVPLNWVENQFFDISSSLLQCALHGAQFKPEDGFCISGPCVGRSLEKINITEYDNHIQVEIPNT